MCFICVKTPLPYFGYNFAVSPCTTNPCQHDGTCSVNGNGLAICNCKGRWDGATCTGNDNQLQIMFKY